MGFYAFNNELTVILIQLETILGELIVQLKQNRYYTETWESGRKQDRTKDRRHSQLYAG